MRVKVPIAGRGKVAQGCAPFYFATDTCMKIAIATQDFETVTGHAGQARHWLVFDCEPDQALPQPQRILLDAAQVFHHFQDTGPHPLDGVNLIITRSAGDGFRRHLRKRGADVLLTGESDPAVALEKTLAGEALPDPQWDPSLLLCKLKDLFSRH